MNRTGEQATLKELAVYHGTVVFHSRIPAQKDFATEQELFWKVRSYPNQGQTAKSETFPHTVSIYQNQHSKSLDSANCSYDVLQSSFRKVYFTSGSLFWTEEHWIAKCCSLETCTFRGVSFLSLKKQHKSQTV